MEFPFKYTVFCSCVNLIVALQDFSKKTVTKTMIVVCKELLEQAFETQWVFASNKPVQGRNCSNSLRCRYLSKPFLYKNQLSISVALRI